MYSGNKQQMSIQAVKSDEGNEILLSIQANILSCHSFTGSGRICEIPG